MSQQMSFPPEVLARIAPDVSLQRHLAIGLRPNLRNFTEFKPIEFSTPEVLANNGSRIAGSSIVKSGSTTIINTITLGIVENNNTGSLEPASTQKYASVYPVIEVLRGRSGEPIDEEQILSQSLYETLLHSKTIPQSSLHIDHLGILLDESNILYPDVHPEEFSLLTTSYTKRSYSFVLLSNIKVFSKQVSTSSLFDLCYTSTLKALQSIKLPRVYLNVGGAGTNPGTKISMRARNSGKRGMVGINDNNLNIDTNTDLAVALKLSTGDDAMDVDTQDLGSLGISSNFGIISVRKEDEVASVLLADLEGEAEETSIFSRVSVIANNNDSLKKISLISGDAEAPVSLEMLRNTIEISKLRAKEFS